MIELLPDELCVKIYKIVFCDVLSELGDYFTDLAEEEYWNNK